MSGAASAESFQVPTKLGFSCPARIAPVSAIQMNTWQSSRFADLNIIAVARSHRTCPFDP
jgi:hypothetical protein